MATTEQKAEASQLLRDIGWSKLDSTSVMEFQRGFSFGLLVPDNDPGELTLSAMRHSAKLGGKASDNFRFAEFGCKHCGAIRLHRDLVRGLEVVRGRWYKNGMTITSAYRCPTHNANIGGAKASVHLSGGAADIDAQVPLEDMMSLSIFGGIGAIRNSGRKCPHVDVRNADNSVHRRGGSPTAPSIWGYDPKTHRFGAALDSWHNFSAKDGPGLPPLLTWKLSKPAPPKIETDELAPKWADDKTVDQRIDDLEKRVAALEA